MKCMFLAFSFFASAHGIQVLSHVSERAPPRFFCGAVGRLLARVDRDSQAVSYCSAVLDIQTFTVDITVPTTQTITETAMSTAFAEVTAVTGTTTSTFTSTITRYNKVCASPVGVLQNLEALTSDPPTSGVKIEYADGGHVPRVFRALPKSAVSAICSCLTIPTPTTTATYFTTFTARTTQDIITTVPTVIEVAATAFTTITTTKVVLETISPVPTLTGPFYIRVLSSAAEQGTYLAIELTTVPDQVRYPGYVTDIATATHFYLIENGWVAASDDDGNFLMIANTYGSGSSMSNGQIFFESTGRFLEGGGVANPLICCQNEDAVLICSTQLEVAWNVFDICPSTENLWIGTEPYCSERKTVLQIVPVGQQTCLCKRQDGSAIKDCNCGGD